MTSEEPVKTATGEPPRKGAKRRSDISAEVLSALNRGELATANLVEWLAIDMPQLCRHVLKDIGQTKLPPGWLKGIENLNELGILQKTEQIAAAINDLFSDKAIRSAKLTSLAAHTSDCARIWAAYIAGRVPGQTLSKSLKAIRPFAADPHFGVRECAWMAVRPQVASQLDEAIKLLTPWAKEKEANIRRFAIEVLRPKGVWCAHLSELKTDPSPVLPILEAMKAEPERYAQLSVANWLNDASHSQPGWVTELCTRWKQESDNRHTAWIVNHALRTIRKGR
jgi:3-methyladenine DNA glycosylase AlkC